MKLHPVASALLWPASLLYGAVTLARRWLYGIGALPVRRLRGVVVSIGNLTVGGTGKTPLVFTLAQKLHDRGKKVGILSRGYKGHAKTDENLAGERPPSVILSDETWLMQRELEGKVTLGVGANRYAHGRALEAKGIEWFLLDDGFQHRRLYRDVDIVLLDATNPFGNRRLLPSGALREPVSSLERADIIVITRSEKSPALEAIVRHYAPAVPVFYAQTQLKEIVPAEECLAPGGPSEWLGQRVFVFCGIGNPDAFLQDARSWGMEVAGSRVFPDHHRYSQEDVQAIENSAIQAGAQILLCTDKDTYNLQGTRFQRLPLYVARVQMRIADEPGFWGALYEVIERRRGAQIA